jgi:hypothetical protein
VNPRRLTHLPAGLGWTDDPPRAPTRAIAAAAAAVPLDPYAGDLRAHFMAPFEPPGMPAPIRPGPGLMQPHAGAPQSPRITAPGGMDTLRDVTPRSACRGSGCGGGCGGAPDSTTTFGLSTPAFRGNLISERAVPADFPPWQTPIQSCLRTITMTESLRQCIVDVMQITDGFVPWPTCEQILGCPDVPPFPGSTPHWRAFNAQRDHMEVLRHILRVCDDRELAMAIITQYCYLEVVCHNHLHCDRFQDIVDIRYSRPFHQRVPAVGSRVQIFGPCGPTGVGVGSRRPRFPGPVPRF